MEKRNMGHEERYEENDALHDLLNQIIEELEPFQVGEEGGKL